MKLSSSKLECEKGHELIVVQVSHPFFQISVGYRASVHLLDSPNSDSAELRVGSIEMAGVVVCEEQAIPAEFVMAEAALHYIAAFVFLYLRAADWTKLDVVVPVCPLVKLSILCLVTGEACVPVIFAIEAYVVLTFRAHNLQCLVILGYDPAFASCFRAVSHQRIALFCTLT